MASRVHAAVDELRQTLAAASAELQPLARTHSAVLDWVRRVEVMLCERAFSAGMLCASADAEDSSDDEAAPEPRAANEDAGPSAGSFRRGTAVCSENCPSTNMPRWARPTSTKRAFRRLLGSTSAWSRCNTS